MNIALLSAHADAPPGFRPGPPPWHELLSGSVVLYAETQQAANRLLPDLASQLQGVLLLPGAATAPQRLGPLCWLLQLPPSRIADCTGLLEQVLQVVEEAASLKERMEAGELRLARMVAELENVRSDYNRVTARLLGQVRALSEAHGELSRANELLEQRVAQRTAELTRVNEELRALMQQLVQAEKLAELGRLVAGVAHELNTPLGNALIASSTLVDLNGAMRHLAQGGSLRRSELLRFIEQSEDNSTVILRNAQRAATLIENFKQVAVDQTSMRRRRFDLAKLVADLLTALGPSLRRLPHKLELAIPDGLELDSYPGALEQVLSNLILNAARHAYGENQGGTIRISGGQRDSQNAWLEVCDDGVGMSHDIAARAFEPFFTTGQGAGGSGLGLYIAHNLTHGLLGGQLTLTTAPGAGCRFELCLRLHAADMGRNG